MEVMVERCGGLDVHKDTVVACLRFPSPDGERVTRRWPRLRRSRRISWRCGTG